MKKALFYILKSIVTNPENIKIDEKEENGIINFEVSIAKEDMGKVIGKNGRVIRAIRNVIKINAIKQNKKINITLAEVP